MAWKQEKFNKSTQGKEIPTELVDFLNDNKIEVFNIVVNEVDFTELVYEDGK